MENDNKLSSEKTNTKGQIISKGKKNKEQPKEIIINFKFEDFEPVANKYQPAYKKQHGKIYYENIDILDQSRFKFVLNMIISKSSNNYSKYSNQLNSNLQWEDIFSVIDYSVDVNTCPICLEKKLVCPMITRCGHIFCWPCIYNYFDYWIKSTPNKTPQCPLCKEKIILSQLKFCEIFQCIHYLSIFDTDKNYNSIEKEISIENKNSLNYSLHTHFITFNLIMKNKKAPTLYNIKYDPELEYYKNNLNQKDAFNFIPLENEAQFNFSKIFLTNEKLILKKLNGYKNQLEEALQDELNLYADVRKVESFYKCLEIINIKINKIKINENSIDDGLIDEGIIDENNNNDYNSHSIKSESNSQSKSQDLQELNPNNNFKNFNEKSNSENINENFSTIDEDLQKSDLKLKDFLYFYQEQFGDIYFLHPINYSILLYEYHSEEHLPIEFTGRILEVEMHQVTSFIKNKYPFLNHLKIGSMFFLVEIDMKQLVSNHTLKQFHNILKDRAKIRNSIKREEEHYDNYVQNLKSKEERKLSHDLIINSKQFKIKEYFSENENEDEENELNVDRKESIDTVDKKENKLKLILENKIMIDSEKEKIKKNKEKSKFCFSAEDFPEISDQIPNSKPNLRINENENQILTKYVNDLDLLKETPNEVLEEGFEIAKSKYKFKNSKNKTKGKKFTEINSDLLKQIEENRMDPDLIEEGEEEEEYLLMRNLKATTIKNKKKVTTILSVKKGNSGNSKKK